MTASGGGGAGEQVNTILLGFSDRVAVKLQHGLAESAACIGRGGSEVLWHSATQLVSEARTDRDSDRRTRTEGLGQTETRTDRLV